MRGNSAFLRAASLLLCMALLASAACTLRTQKPAIDLDEQCILLATASKQATFLLFQNVAKKQGDERAKGHARSVSEYVATVVLPMLKEKNCAGIQLKVLVLDGLKVVAKRLGIGQWELLLSDVIELLDSLYNPKIECSQANLRLLEAFFAGIRRGCLVYLGSPGKATTRPEHPQH